ncbi:hypothetical protein [Leptospira vanthielii]|nr:hypothetical protein [Leptospira vanthielii]
MDELLELGSKALRIAALNIDAKNFILNNEALFITLKKAANRYIGGDTLEETITKVISENQNGFKCSIEFMGESTKTIQETIEVTDEFLRIVEGIKTQKLYSTISLDLSHIGLTLSKEFCRDNLEKICKEAKKNGIEVIVSAEDVEKLISKNHKCSIATHHHKIQQETKTLIEKYIPNQSSYEFESLYGIQTENLATLREEGHPTKLYFVYGKEWYLYLCNRIAEYPLNIFRALDDIVSS